MGTDSALYGMLAVGIPTEFFLFSKEEQIEQLDSEPEDVMSQLMDVSVSVRSTLPPFQLSYQSLQEISLVGSVLPLPKNWNKNLRIIINDTVAFLGEYGVEEGAHAVKIHTRYRKKKIGLNPLILR